MTAGGYVPRACVWEVTLRCNAKCVHCGSDAGRPRDDELDTAEALALVEDLAALGCRSVTLSGGEPLLRADWPLLVRAILENEMRAELITNGLTMEGDAEAVAGAGFWGVTFSVDGPAEVHDELRGVPGALQRLLAGADELAAKGVRIGAATQIGRRNAAHLAEVHDLLLRHGFLGWQVQLTMPQGRAAAQGDSLCLSPSELPELEATLLRLKSRDEKFLQIADNIGYMGRNEPKLRVGSPLRYWTGCQAGLQVIGLTSDGVVRGCLSLPPQLDEGSIRKRPLAEIWLDPEAFAYNRRFDRRDLEGDCRDCPFGDLCRGGCTSLAYATTGRTTSCTHCLSLTWKTTDR